MSNPATERFDFAVIGAGIAGASVAAELARSSRVALLEMESQPGYHTTGRSAAVFAESYGPSPVRALTRASAAFFENPPSAFATNPLLSPRGVLMIASESQIGLLDNLIDEISADLNVVRLDAEATIARNPLLRRDYVAASMLDVRARDIDVHGLHNGYLRQLMRSSGQLYCDFSVVELERSRSSWRISSRDRSIDAAVVINAAGAWADEVGALAGAMQIGLVPKRRTIAVVQSPHGRSLDDAPITVDCAEAFYLKPDSGRLLVSPADQTPSPPCDAQPDELDIALCVDRVERAFDLQVNAIEGKWAGLRSFVADGCPVCGFDPGAPDFFWFAAQGGYGIQMAPALARLASQIANGQPVPPDIVDKGFRLADIAPKRLQTSRKAQQTGRKHGR